MNSTDIAARLLEDEDFDPKAYIMAGPVSYHPVHRLTTGQVRTWFLKHYGAPVKSIYRDKQGQIHGWALDRENIFNMNRANPSPAESEYAVKVALKVWLNQAVRDGERILPNVHYWDERKQIFFDLWRDDGKFWTGTNAPRG